MTSSHCGGDGLAWGEAGIGKVSRIHLCGRMQRETGRQGFSSRGFYRINEFQLFSLFERVLPGRIVFARLSTFRHQFRGGSRIRARHYNLYFHCIQTSSTFDAGRRGATQPVSGLPRRVRHDQSRRMLPKSFVRKFRWPESCILFDMSQLGNSSGEFIDWLSASRCRDSQGSHGGSREVNNSQRSMKMVLEADSSMPFHAKLRNSTNTVSWQGRALPRGDKWQNVLVAFKSRQSSKS